MDADAAAAINTLNIFLFRIVFLPVLFSFYFTIFLHFFNGKYHFYDNFYEQKRDMHLT